MEVCGRRKVQERVAHVPASVSDNGCVELPSQPGARGAQESTLRGQTPSERSQGEMEHAKRLRYGKQTKAEWWDTERLDRYARCVVDGDCSHSKRAVQERWKSTCLELTLCNHEFLPHRERLRV